MKFTDIFPLVGPELTPAGPWKTPRNYQASEGECFGVPTGPRNNCWVLDLDTKGGKSGIASLHAHIIANDLPDLPDTYTVRTKSGGVHLYFTLPEDGTVIGNRTGVLLGVDVRGAGGYVRAGGPLYPVLADVGPVPAPAWLVALVASKARADVGTSAIAITPDHPEWAHRYTQAQAYLAGAPPCIEGQGGDAQLWKAALTLSRTYELPIATSLELLEPYNARCLPPWSVEDLARKLRDAAEKGTSIPGTFPAGFLEPPAPRMVLASPVSEWRQRPNPDHKYTFDLAVDIAGSGKSEEIDQRALTAAFTGPGANPDWCGVWQYDQFASRLYAINPPLKLNAEDRGFDTTDIASIKMWLVCRTGCKATNAQIEEAIKSAAFAAGFHPLREYLHELPPVTTAHLASPALAVGVFGSSAEDAPHVVDFLRRWMIGCIARVMCPGAKFDTVLTLLGPGGWRKSEFFKVLAVDPEWYRSNIPDIADPQKVGLAMRGHWIVELGELTTMRSSQRDSFLEFITRTDEKFRSPYEKTEVTEKRQCGIGATANNVEFMSSLDGAIQRRFLPIEVKKRIDTHWIETHRDALWAEAFAAYNAGESWWTDNEAALDRFKESFTDATPIEELIVDFLKVNANRARIDGKSATAIYNELLGDAQRTVVPNSHQRLELGRALKSAVGVTPRGHARGRCYSVRPVFDGVAQSDEDRAASKESLVKKSAGSGGFFDAP